MNILKMEFTIFLQYVMALEELETLILIMMVILIYFSLDIQQIIMVKHTELQKMI